MAPTAWLAKVRLVGERLATAAVPVPVRLTVCGLPVALSVRVTAARASSTGGRREGHADRAIGSCRYACPAIIGLSKVAGIGTRQREAGDAQGGVARVAQGEGLSCTGRTYGLVAEGKAGG